MSSILPALTPSVPTGVAIIEAAAFILNGIQWRALNFNGDGTNPGTTPYSLLANVGAGLLRFEALNGQNCTQFSDPAWVIRSEVYGPGFPFNVNVTFSFGLLVRSQHPTVVTNNWNIVGQLHGDDTNSGPPPFAFDIQPDPGGPTGEKLQFDINSQATLGGPSLVIGSIPFSRNTLYQCEVVFRDANGASTGYAQVIINGVVEATFNGVTGYSAAVQESYPKFGYYGGGNGSSATDLPLAGQDWVVQYSNVQFSSLVPAFYLASPSAMPPGDDANPGTLGAPFATVGKAISAMTASGSIKTTYVRAGTIAMSSTWAPGAGQTLMAYPGDALNSATITNTVSGSGTFNVSSITLFGLNFTGSANDGGAVLEFDACPGLKVQACDITVSQNQQCLSIYNPGAGTRIQGNSWTGPTGASGSVMIFLFNCNCTDGLAHDDVIVNSNTSNGGTYAMQIQCLGAQAAWTNWHFDWNTCAGYGYAGASGGSEGISLVGSTSASNADNTCTGNTLTSWAGAAGGGGIEAGTAGCTYAQNVITAEFPISVSESNNSLYVSNNLTGNSDAFTPGGGYASATPSTIEIGANTINGSSVTGCVGGSCTLSPPPSGTVAANTPSAPYVP